MAEVQDLEVEEAGELEVVEQQATDVPAEASAPTEEPDIPSKYKGKSVLDIVRMHQEAEQLIGKQSKEVGEVRKLADELLRSQLTPKPEPEKPKEIDFFENPQEAIRQAVETNPEVQMAKQYAIQARQAQARQALVQKHPDFGQVVQDPEFTDWVKASKVRVRLFQEAEAFDVDAADELLSTFKTLKSVKQKQVSEAEVQARSQSLKAAAVDTSGSGEGSKKVYRRADLIRLKMTNPAKFDAMQDEIDAAYRDGRVK